MDIRVRQANKVTVVYLVGTIDVNSARIIELIGRLIREGRANLLFNFQHVELVDNNGLSILAIAYKYAVNQDASIKLCSVPLAIRNILDAAHLSEVFEIYDDEADAIRSCDKITKIDKLRLRRRFKRLDLGIEAEFKLSIASKPVFFKGRVKNLSGDGLFIYSKKTLPVGSQLDIELRLEGESKSLRLTGVVIWLADKELQPHVYPGMGIEFIRLGNAPQKKLINFIDKNISHRTRESTI